jgi:hypothetical protein
MTPQNYSRWPRVEELVATGSANAILDATLEALRMLLRIGKGNSRLKKRVPRGHAVKPRAFRTFRWRLHSVKVLLTTACLARRQVRKRFRVSGIKVVEYGSKEAVV